MATYWETVLVELDWDYGRAYMKYSHEQVGVLESAREAFGKALRENDSSSRQISYDTSKVHTTVMLWFLCESRWEPCAAYGDGLHRSCLLYKRQTEVGD